MVWEAKALSTWAEPRHQVIYGGFRRGLSMPRGVGGSGRCSPDGDVARHFHGVLEVEGIRGYAEGGALSRERF